MAAGSAVIERILPNEVIAVDTREDLIEVKLFPEEEQAIVGAVEKRRREFVTARACARTALQRLGIPAQPISHGERGSPRWPAGIVGSITHCNGYRACALAPAGELVTIGIDAEPNAQLPDGVLESIARPEERRWIEELARGLPETQWDRLLFSAKESVYKAWFPLAQRWLGFEDATLSVDPSTGEFTARLLVEGPLLGQERLAGFSGRWLIEDGLVITAIAMPVQR